MATILLISPQTLKDEYTIDDNLDDKYIVSHIKKCQDFIIEPLLGDILYDEIITGVESGTTTEQNKVLIEDYIQPIIAYFVISEVVFTTAYKMKNQGMEVGDPSRFSELVKISQKYMNDCNTYQQILREYVCENSIPIFTEKDTIKTGIYLGTSYKRDYLNQPNKVK